MSATKAPPVASGSTSATTAVVVARARPGYAATVAGTLTANGAICLGRLRDVPDLVAVLLHLIPHAPSLGVARQPALRGAGRGVVSVLAEYVQLDESVSPHFLVAPLTERGAPEPRYRYTLSVHVASLRLVGRFRS